MYQFIHIETYARQASTKQKPTKKAGAKTEAKAKQNLSGIIAEAIRAEGNCPHVTEPQAPRYIVGNDAVMQGMQAEIERNLDAHHKRVGGKKVRSDAHVLLAGVASFPRDLQNAEPETYEKWERKTVEWLQKKYGDDLKVVLMHNDEDHPHIHFYVYSAEKVNAKELHDGYLAAAKLPPMTKEAGIAHANAMREMQSAYYADVAHECGLLRDGPKRKRMDRATYKAIQREERERVALGKEVAQVHADLLNGAASEAKAAAELRRVAEHDKNAIAIAKGDTDFDRQELLYAQQGLKLEQDRLNEQRANIQREAAALDEAWAKARDFRAELEKRENDCIARESVIGMKEVHAAETMKAAKQARSVADQKWDRATQTLQEAERLGALYIDAQKQLLEVHDVAKIAARPELEGMLKFLDENEDARDWLFLMQHDPEMAQYVVTAMTMSNTLKSQAAEDYSTVNWSAMLQASEEASKTKSKDSGLDFGM